MTVECGYNIFFVIELLFLMFFILDYNNLTHHFVHSEKTEVELQQFNASFCTFIREYSIREERSTFCLKCKRAFCTKKKKSD